MSILSEPADVAILGGGPGGYVAGLRAAQRSTPTPADGVIAYYMHGKVRCPTCVNIEEYAHEAVAKAAARARTRLVS